MSRARRALPHGKAWGSGLLLVAGFAAVAVAVVAVAAQFQPEGGQGAAPPPASSTPAVVLSASGAVPQQKSEPDSRAACAAELDALDEVVETARIAAGHWQEHVQARTDLLAGKNTEATTKAIWKRTRLAGPADIARLETAKTEYGDAAGGCRGLTTAEASVCKQRLSALEATANSGRAASADWAAHLAMMRAHADGDFGAEHAQEMWVSAWQGAARNLNAFARAETALTKAPACSLS